MVSTLLPPFSLTPISQAAAATELYPHASEVSSVALGGHVLSTSDEWFAPASDLLKVAPAPSLKGSFGPKGAKFDGWETRRHNPLPQGYDWVILRLGPVPGAHILGLDIDTANFNGNEAPHVEVYALTVDHASEEAAPAHLEENDPRWTVLLPRTPCAPSQQHLFLSDSNQPTQQAYTHIKLVMVPDGGIARFRVYGTIPPPPLGLGIGEDAHTATLDLAHVLNGGRVVFTSDQHFGKGSNLILPGRGADMGDGWETKRSRSKDHKDWVVIQLAQPALLTSAEFDTIHFLGNFPESVELHALDLGEHPGPALDLARLGHQDEAVAGWTQILPRSKLGPGKQHFFDLQSHTSPVSHVRVSMHPDGGIKRVRLVGRRLTSPADSSTLPLPTAAQSSSHAQSGSYPIPDSYPVTGKSEYDSELRSVLLQSSQPLDPSHPTPPPPPPSFHPHLVINASTTTTTTTTTTSGPVPVNGAGNASHVRIPIEPLTHEAYAPYGSVIAGPSVQADASANTKSQTVNQGTASKFLSLSSITSLYPASTDAKAHIHIFRCAPRFPLPRPSSQSSASSTEPTIRNSIITPAASCFEVKVLERHRYTTQAFIPMTSDPDSQHGYLVIVAQPQSSSSSSSTQDHAPTATETENLPDLSTLRAFLATSTQAISYHPGIWHHPMLALGTTHTDFACIVHESDSHPHLNCDEVFYPQHGSGSDDGDGDGEGVSAPLVML